MTVPLPPLPPAPGDDHAYRPGGRSLLAVLADEHRRITGLCRELADRDTTGARRAELVEVVVATLTRHLSAEEQYLHPTVRATVPAGELLAERELAADRELLRVLRALSDTGPDDPGFAGSAQELLDRLRRHARAAEAEIFPPVREVADDAELIRLGNRLLVAEEAAPT
ncbi:MAG TPA: hemerythrin domain-containing protein, partial [Micromonospora sp.]